MQKQKDFQPRVMYVVKLQIKCDGRMKAFFKNMRPQNMFALRQSFLESY